ncbi:MAG: hypothetical protein MI974_01260 [Chitinophagales bacterium]|nr:hypothetical protein [Chitinophagales bacterium]
MLISTLYKINITLLVIILGPLLAFSQSDSSFQLIMEHIEGKDGLYSLTLINHSTQELIISSSLSTHQQNELVILDPSGKKVSYAFSHCPDTTTKIAPNQSFSWEYDIVSSFFYPFVWREKPRGRYELYWEVKGKRTNSFFYDHQ